MKKYFVLELVDIDRHAESRYWCGLDAMWCDLDLNKVSIFSNTDEAFITRSKLYKKDYVDDLHEVLVRELNIGIGNIVLQKFFLVHDQDTNKFFVAPNVWVCNKEKAKKFPGTMTVAEITREFIGGEYGPNVVITECKE